MSERIALSVAVATATVLASVAATRPSVPASSSDVPPEERVEGRRVPRFTIDGRGFKDLNKNGALDPYEDWRLGVDARVADLLRRMTLEEKAGLMVHASLSGFTGPNGIVLDAPAPGPGGPNPVNPRPRSEVTPLDRPAPQELILARNVRWILVRPTAGEEPAVTARFANGLQEIAEGSRLGIPIALSSDPRHSPRRTAAGAAPPRAGLSEWPEQIGLGAMRDPAAVREFGRIAAQEYRALGLHVSLSPMADLATEPRWNRVSGTFGEDAALAAELVGAYVTGLQGRQLGPQGVMAVTKHWPGDGPVKDGQDPHNDYGRWQVYPGGRFDHHLIPFQAAFAAGTGGIMGGYAIPVGFDTVGISFSRRMIGDLLRKKHRFDGVVVTDWLRNMPWGVEHLDEKERQRLIVEAGVDQIGGDNDPRLVVELVRERRVAESRINESARRVLRPMFQLGLFEDPYVDPSATQQTVGKSEFVRAGAVAQRRSIVLLKNERSLLPLPAAPKLYVENMDREVARRYGTVVDSPADAQVALVKVDAPYALHAGGGSFFRGSHEGTLAYDGAENAGDLAAIKRVAAAGRPTIVCVYLERPAVLAEFIGQVDAVVAHFNSDDAALLDVVFGRHRQLGRLPFALPRDMSSVVRQKEDVPFDLEEPLFQFGFGLDFPAPKATRLE